MIHPAYNKSEIARRYFLAKGEDLSRQEAINRFRMIRNVDIKAISKIYSEIFHEGKNILKKDNED